MTKVFDTELNCYRIKDWDKHYENAESRKLRSASVRYVLFPNKHDGKGFARMANHKSSVAILCGWTLILQVASKMPERGLLMDEDGPLSMEDLAAKTRYPSEVFEIALEVLSDPAIGWIEKIECPLQLIPSGNVPGRKRSAEPIALDNSQESKNNKKEKNLKILPVSPNTSQRLPTSPEGREGKGIEGKGTLPPKSPLGGDDVDWTFPEKFSNGFKEVWQSWVTYRRRAFKKPKSGDDLFHKQLEWISRFNEPTAIEVLEQSLRNGYQGLFAPKNNHSNPKQQNGNKRKSKFSEAF